MTSETPFTLLLTGPAGAGKTTVARAWAESRAYPAAHVSLDDVRDFVKSGYADPEYGWNGETKRQYDLARDTCAVLATRYVSEGFHCAIDDAIFPEWEEVGYAGWREALGETPHVVVVLLPRFEFLLERNRPREGHRRLSERTMRIIYEDMLPWKDGEFPVIDNSNLSVEETVEAVEREARKMSKTRT